MKECLDSSGFNPWTPCKRVGSPCRKCGHDIKIGLPKIQFQKVLLCYEMKKVEQSQHNFFYLPVGNLICLTVQMVDNFVVLGNSRHLKAPGFCCRSSFDQGRTVGCRILPQKPENVTLISRKKTTVIYSSAKKLISNWLESTPLRGNEGFSIW